jgi:hypothetical protein
MGEIVVAKQIAKMRTDARRAYGEMQKTWYMFAKVITNIRRTESFREMVSDHSKDNFNTFQEFCEEEFSSISFSTIMKFTKIVDRWEKILDARLSKDPHAALPAYESCYQLATVEEKLSKEDFQKLRKGIVEGKFGYHSLRERLKEILETAREKVESKSS